MLPGLQYRRVRAGGKPRRPLRDDSRAGPMPTALQVWMLPGCDEASRSAGASPWLARDAERAAIDATASEIARLLRAAAEKRLMLGLPGKAPGNLGEKAVEASDIAVLVRTNAQGSRVREALHRLGVGSVELAQESIYATRDAEELDRVLTAVLEPSRERALKAALSTQAMGFDATQIAALAGDESSLAVQAQRFAAWRDVWQAQGVAVMLRRWMVDARVAARLLARPDDGERRLTNLLHLVERLHDASSDHAQPRTLLRWLQSARVDSAGPTPDETAQLRLESDRHLVQIVTVHKSKGLEYPFVFCPLLWLPARTRPSGMEGLAVPRIRKCKVGRRYVAHQGRDRFSRGIARNSRTQGTERTHLPGSRGRRSAPAVRRADARGASLRRDRRMRAAGRQTGKLESHGAFAAQLARGGTRHRTRRLG